MTPEYREKLMEEWEYEYYHTQYHNYQITGSDREFYEKERYEDITNWWLSKFDTLLEDKVKEIRELRIKWEENKKELYECDEMEFAANRNELFSTIDSLLEAAEKVITNIYDK